MHGVIVGKKTIQTVRETIVTFRRYYHFFKAINWKLGRGLSDLRS